MNIVDGTYMNKAVFLAAIDPRLEWLQPPVEDEVGDIVYERHLMSWRSGALRLVINDETFQPNLSIVEPLDDFYSVLTLGERFKGVDSSKINIIATREKPFGFDNPGRVAESIRLTELALVQDRKLQALARVKAAIGNLDRDLKVLEMDAMIDDGLDGVAVVEDIVVGLQDSGLSDRYRSTATALLDMGVERIEGPGSMPGWGDTLHPGHVIKCIDEGVGYFAA